MSKVSVTNPFTSVTWPDSHYPLPAIAIALDETRPLDFLAGVSHRKGSWLRSTSGPCSPFPALDTLPGFRH